MSSSATRVRTSGQRRYTDGRLTPARLATSTRVVRRTPNSVTHDSAASRMRSVTGSAEACASIA
ncbi:Uncharacterised protein [Mycobacteroides abscessus subsp. abscessus]|nr:Uncharacterised protein [Mycobacteroides abscessus subsp. abscessus]SKW96290.1 Uncharacterised protein [Mycobacteroides abscessus subsp. abscessus]